MCSFLGDQVTPGGMIGQFTKKNKIVKVVTEKEGKNWAASSFKRSQCQAGFKEVQGLNSIIWAGLPKNIVKFR